MSGLNNNLFCQKLFFCNFTVIALWQVGKLNFSPRNFLLTRHDGALKARRPTFDYSFIKLPIYIWTKIFFHVEVLRDFILQACYARVEHMWR